MYESRDLGGLAGAVLEDDAARRVVRLEHEGATGRSGLLVGFGLFAGSSGGFDGIFGGDARLRCN